VLELESVRVAVSLSSIVSSIFYILALWTKSGQKKSFRFLTGAFCMITTVAFSFRLALDVTNFSFIMLIVWFLLTLMIFALATWLSKK